VDEPDLSYIFKHVLTQESAYQSLLTYRRREIHREVVDYIAAHAKDQQRAGFLSLEQVKELQGQS